MAGIVAPNDYPIRDPKDPKQVNGRIVNPVRYIELGGLDGPGKWPKGNEMRVEPPTKVKGARSSVGKGTD